MDMRGLANFIQDIRKATTNKDEEQKRIDLELSKIRSKFSETGKMSPYDRKKYVCKLMFIAMLGYPVDFGHMEGVQLLSGDSSSEKLIGYLSLSVFLNENHELLTLTTHTVHLDLLSGKEFNTCLALTAIGNAGGRDFAEAMAHGVEKLILAKVSPNVRKKALLAMLRLYRKYKEVVDLSKIVPAAVELITDTNMGVANCAVEFIQGVLDSSADIEEFLVQVPGHCVSVLEKIIMHKTTEVDYIYYSVPAPWLQTKVLRLLQYFPCPQVQLLERVVRILEKIQSATDRVLTDAQTHQRQRGTQNRCNAMNAVLVEVLSLAVQWNCKSLLEPSLKVLKNFVRDRKEANLRYIGLVLATRFSFWVNGESRFNALIEELQQEVFLALEDPDVSIRKRALELIYCACGPANANEVMSKFIELLPRSDPTFKTDLVLNIAVLAEKFCVDYAKYSEVILGLLLHAGDCVPKEVWYRLIHTVISKPEIQKRVTEHAFNILVQKSVPEVVVQVASFLLGEFGYTIAANAGSEPHAQLIALQSKLSSVSVETKCIILSTHCKLYNLYAVPLVRESIVNVFEQYQRNIHPEIQQRASEYLLLVKTLNDEELQSVLEPLPPFEKHSSIMPLFQLRQLVTDRDIWREKSQLRDDQQLTATEIALKEIGQQLNSNQVVPKPVASVSSSPPTKEKKVDLDSYFSFSQASKNLAVNNLMKNYFFSLMLNVPKGPLFESEEVRISVSHEYRDADGRVTLTVENRTPHPMTSFSMSIVSTPANLILQNRPSVDRIEPNSSCNILFACRSLGGFIEAPIVSFAWKEAADHIALKLPVGVQKFTSPYTLKNQQEFEVLWESMNPGNATFAAVAHIAKFHSPSALLDGLTVKLGLWAHTTNSELTRTDIIAAGSFSSMSDQLRYHPVLLKVQFEADSAMILCKSPVMELQQMMLTLLDYLSAK